MRIHKGDVSLADLDPAFGHEQQGKRPVLIVQNNIANQELLTVMVALLTSNTQAAFPLDGADRLWRSWFDKRFRRPDFSNAHTRQTAFRKTLGPRFRRYDGNHQRRHPRKF